MTWTFADCEDDAGEMRALAEVGASEDLTPREIGEAAGVTFTRRVASGCDGELDAEEMTVYSHGRGHPSTRNYNDAHELIHLVRALNLDPFPHDEERVDWGAMALMMPRGLVREVLQRVSLDDPPALIRAFPGVPPAMVLLRVAWVLRRPVAVHRRGARWEWVPEGYQVPERGVWWEQRLVRLVKTTMKPEKNLLGAVGVPIGALGTNGVLVIYPRGGTGGW